jgi:hypothetical protein
VKKSATILGIILLGHLLMAFGLEPAAELINYKVVLDDTSIIRIAGKTNINSFSCEHNNKLNVDTLHVQSNSVGSYFELRDSEISVPVAGFECGLSQMTREMMDLLEEESYPDLKLNVLSLKRDDNKVEAFTLITIAGNGVVYKVCSTLKGRQNWTSCKGTLDLNIRDFGLEPPTKFLGAVRVKEMITIEFDLKLKIIEV